MYRVLLHEHAHMCLRDVQLATSSFLMALCALMECVAGCAYMKLLAQVFTALPGLLIPLLMLPFSVRYLQV